MGLCRVDTDRLRDLASRLGTTAVALDEAVPAATLLWSHGFAPEGAAVATALTAASTWLQDWSASLHLRSELVDAAREFFVTPTWSSPGHLELVDRRGLAATHVGRPQGIAGIAGVEPEEVAAAAQLIRRARGIGPAEVAAAMQTTPAHVATALAISRPELVGSSGGAPHELRALANRIALDRALAVAGSAAEDSPEARALALLAGGDRSFLLFDWEASRIVEWIGPFDADHVAIYVPGAGISRLDYPDLASRVGRIVQLDSTDGDLAVVVALTYSPPPTVVHAALGSYADEGGAELVELVAGLDLTGRHVSVIGHSYGSVVVGEALHRGLADRLPAEVDVVVLGSPGVRADHLSELGLAPSNFWAALLPGDEISHALHPSAVALRAACATSGLAAVVESCASPPHLIHGFNPAHPAFGGQTFGRPEGAPGIGGHADYLAVTRVGRRLQPSFVLRQLLAILVGRPPHPG